MALIDDIKAICDRLAPLGWRDLIKAVTNGELDIKQSTTAKLKTEMIKDLTTVLDKFGFEDFHPQGRGITAGQPSRSVLYHALASPGVDRDANGNLLQGFPTLKEIETVEDFVFAESQQSLAQLTAAGKWSVVVFAVEYRPAQDSVDGKHADLAFSRTGISRVGTSDLKYLDAKRGFWPEDETDVHGFRVIPSRYTVWLAQQSSSQSARVMRTNDADTGNDTDKYWIPVHKLFEGGECLTDVPNITFNAELKLFNLKLQRVMKSRNKNVNGFPFEIDTPKLAELRQKTDLGRFVVVPKTQAQLVAPAENAGTPLTYRVPADPANSAFATYSTASPIRVINGRRTEIHRFPAYVHARTKIVAGQAPIDLNNDSDVGASVAAGNYDAQLYMDFTGEGWLRVSVPKINGKSGVAQDTLPAYLLLSAPDFFPSSGQRELSEWAQDSSQVPASLKDGMFGREPATLCEMRLPANLQLTANSPFTKDEVTVTAVVGMRDVGATAVTKRLDDVTRASTLPDDAAGVFAPGWDVSVDVLGANINTGIPHLAAYGLGSPFPEDAKLCAALSTFWPAVAPDIYRTISRHSGNELFSGTVAPLTDEEIGQIGNLSWDGVQGPKVVQFQNEPHWEMATFRNVDYVANAVQHRFSLRLLSQITADEYQDRLLAAARTHFALRGNGSVETARNNTLFLSFRTVANGDPELQDASNKTQHTLSGKVYRIETCNIGTTDSSIASPRGPRFRLLRLKGRKRHTVFVTASDSKLLLIETNLPSGSPMATWQAIAAE